MDLFKEALSLFQKQYEEAQTCGLPEPTAVALATADKAGRPSVRTVLLKGFDETGFVFYTNMGSRKGRQLMSNPRAALCFWWPPLERQVHVEGPVTLVSDREADAYFASRPRASQLGAWASLQSRPLENRQMLEDRLKEIEKQYPNAVPRPQNWTGFRVDPERMEFWKMRPHRLHERILYEKTPQGWAKSLLYP